MTEKLFLLDNLLEITYAFLEAKIDAKIEDFELFYF